MRRDLGIWLDGRVEMRREQGEGGLGGIHYLKDADKFMIVKKCSLYQAHSILVISDASGGVGEVKRQGRCWL